MDTNELDKMISKYIADDKSLYYLGDAIVDFLAPELEQAKLWTRVKEMANHYDMDGCQECPLNSLGRAICNYVCVEAKKIVDALEGEKDV